ncbi:MAG: hypothetical protein UH241_06490 [Acutalibacteraceae bacterium]|nr:hypothetical protein [Acutalibacteraceae bacterium]
MLSKGEYYTDNEGGMYLREKSTEKSTKKAKEKATDTTAKAGN